MRITGILPLVALLQSASAHYIWTTLISGSTSSTAAVRQPVNNTPVASVSSNDIRCNAHPGAASQTLDNTVYHSGPAAIYLGKAPGSVASWDGSGASWFKIAEWDATFNPFKFTDEGASQLTTTIPATLPGPHRTIGLHVAGAPQCITGSGSGNPAKVSIPEYVSPSDPGLTVNTYYPISTRIRQVPGPAVRRG
ncbi:hypothetical protein BDQ17DRAFT_1389202 [Cyathus striatus]|nr:hypothetical protein BDQ17DRAFT_1389202 [Cyathus striatus]